MEELDFLKFSILQKIIFIVLMLLLGWTTNYVTNFYFGAWPNKIRIIIFVLLWASLGKALEQLILFIKNNR
jgi:hypothetical protein